VASQRVSSPRGVAIPDAPGFISAMEVALAEGDVQFLDRNMPALQELIDQIQRQVFALSQFQLRACQVRDEHAPLSVYVPERPAGTGA
jgi:hypothetical protein